MNTKSKLTSNEIDELSCAIDSNNLLSKVISVNDLCISIKVTTIEDKKMNAKLRKMVKLVQQLNDVCKEVNSMYYEGVNARSRKWIEENKEAHKNTCINILSSIGMKKQVDSILFGELSIIDTLPLNEHSIKLLKSAWKYFDLN